MEKQQAQTPGVNAKNKKAKQKLENPLSYLNIIDFYGQKRWSS